MEASFTNLHSWEFLLGNQAVGSDNLRVRDTEYSALPSPEVPLYLHHPHPPNPLCQHQPLSPSTTLTAPSLSSQTRGVYLSFARQNMYGKLQIPESMEAYFKSLNSPSLP